MLNLMSTNRPVVDRYLLTKSVRTKSMNLLLEKLEIIIKYVSL